MGTVNPRRAVLSSLLLDFPGLEIEYTMWVCLCLFGQSDELATCNRWITSFDDQDGENGETYSPMHRSFLMGCVCMCIYSCLYLVYGKGYVQEWKDRQEIRQQAKLTVTKSGLLIGGGSSIVVGISGGSGVGIVWCFSQETWNKIVPYSEGVTI